MNILDFANNIPNFRQEVKVQHQACDIVFITLAAVICGAGDWEDIEYFGYCKEEFFRKYLKLPNGIPSHDTFNRFFANLNAKFLEVEFRLWVKTICNEESNLISVDGKTIRGAKVGSKSVFHMVIAFCHVNGIRLAQVRTREKSKRNDKNKIYSLDEPGVYCISKGKEHKKYEFGNKVSILYTQNTEVIVGVLSFKNEYDAHTLSRLFVLYLFVILKMV